MLPIDCPAQTRLAPHFARCLRHCAALFTVLGIFWGWGGAAQAQTCPAPWATAQSAYGVFVLTGIGNGSSGTLRQIVNESAQVSAKMAGIGGCSFMAVPAEGFGQMKSNANVNDKLTDSTVPNTFTWVGSGPGDSLGANTSFSINILQPDQYSFGAWDTISGIYTDNGTPTTEDITWGPASSNGGASLQQLPVPAGSPVLWGIANFSSPPFIDTGVITADWQIEWVIAAGPDDDCDTCKGHDRPLKASEISPRGQALGEDVAIVGTSFSLHYESSRMPGHAGVDLFAMNDALGLGGWTLNIHHVFEPMLLGYCAGGGCTPYAVIPKAVFFGDGKTRNDADVQAALQVNGNYYLTSQNGSEVYVFNSLGLHLQTLRPMTGAVLYTFGYDSNNRLISVTDANGNVVSIQRDINGKPTSITAPFGQQTNLKLDANGYLSQITDPAGHTTKLVSSPLGLLTSLTDPLGKVYSLQYDSMGRLTKHSDPGGGSVTLARTDNTSGYTVTNTTGLGRTSASQVAFSSTASQTSQSSTFTWQNGLHATETETQQAGQLQQSSSLPDGTSDSKTLGPDPRWGMQVPVIQSETITRGNLTETVSDSRSVILSDPSNPFSVTSQTEALTVNGRIYNSAYTASTKTLVETSPQNRKTTTVFDDQQRVSTIQPAGLALKTYSYDSHGRVSSILEGTRNTSFAYDTNGYLATVTNALGLPIGLTHDAAGNILSTTLQDGRVINYTYDANGNLKSVTPPGGSPHTYAYSPVNMATSYAPPAVTGGGSTVYTFNPDRDLTKVTRPDGQVINYKYDTAGRLSSMNSPSATITYLYNATTGTLSKASVAGGEAIAYSYNGPLAIRSTWTGAVAGSVSRVFNNNFWVASQSINSANTVAFTYDKDGYMTKGGAATFAHNAQSGLYTGGTLASTSDTIAYNTFAEPTSYNAKFGTTVVHSVTYTRDGIGRITTLKETIGGTTSTYSYTFDQAGRLITVKKNGATVGSYTYDNNSNRIAATNTSGTIAATYDAQDRLLTYGNASYTYNANGELASKSAPSQLTTYQYDVFGNLTSVTLPNSTVISYVVDAENSRVGRKVNGVLAAGYLYEHGNLVAQLDGSNQLVSQFVYSSSFSTPIYMVTGGVTYRIFSDHLGSPRLVVNSATGQIAERIDYDEFGNVISDTNPGFQPFGFAGGLYDQDTKLVRYGMRDYDASTGRWTAKDPLQFAAGDSNLYGYVLSDPIDLTDPTGLEGECHCKQADKIRQWTEAFIKSRQLPDFQSQEANEFKNTRSSSPAATSKTDGAQDVDFSLPAVDINGFQVGFGVTRTVYTGKDSSFKLSAGPTAIQDLTKSTVIFGHKFPSLIPLLKLECEYQNK